MSTMKKDDFLAKMQELIAAGDLAGLQALKAEYEKSTSTQAFDVDAAKKAISDARAEIEKTPEFKAYSGKLAKLAKLENDAKALKSEIEWDAKIIAGNIIVASKVPGERVNVDKPHFEKHERSGVEIWVPVALTITVRERKQVTHAAGFKRASSFALTLTKSDDATMQKYLDALWAIENKYRAENKGAVKPWSQKEFGIVAFETKLTPDAKSARPTFKTGDKALKAFTRNVAKPEAHPGDGATPKPAQTVAQAVQAIAK